MTAQLFSHEGLQVGTTDPASTAGGGRLRVACHRIRLAIRDMNYASRRVVELQAPWSVDEHWHSR